jgi:hypothetical protein
MMCLERLENNMSNKSTRKQFCSKGHDTFITGRYEGQCRACRNRRVIVDKRIKKICVRGHDLG